MINVKVFLEAFEMAQKALLEDRSGVVQLLEPGKSALEVRLSSFADSLVIRDVQPLIDEMYQLGDDLYTRLPEEDQKKLYRITEAAMQAIRSATQIQQISGVAVGLAYSKEYSLEQFIEALKEISERNK